MEATKTKFTDLIADAEIPVLVDFYATWCGPCKTMGPILEEFAKEFSTKVKVIKIDIDKNHEAANAYKIVGVPTLILFHKGEIKWRQSGVVPVHSLRNIINPILEKI